MQYIWQYDFWPNLTWDMERIAPLLDKVTRDQWQLQGLMKGLGFTERSEAHLLALIDDVVKSSEIEGEILPREQVRSSIVSKLGLDGGGLVPADRGVDSVVEMMPMPPFATTSRSPRSDCAAGRRPCSRPGTAA